jgi:hypothetical protein
MLVLPQGEYVSYELERELAEKVVGPVIMATLLSMPIYFVSDDRDPASAELPPEGALYQLAA